MREIRFIKENFGLKIYSADLKGKIVFIKEPISSEGQSMIAREYANQKFLWELSQKDNLGFKFLKPSIIDNKLVFPYLGDEFEWLSNQKKNRIKPIGTYFNELSRFIIYCHDKIIQKQLPHPIKQDSLQRSKQNALNKFEADADYLLKNKIITRFQLSDLRKNFLGIADVRAFQHHDPVPWHMAKHKKTKEIYLIDSGWAGWSLWAYDISYFILQIIAYGNDLRTVKYFYQRMKNIYAKNPDFDQYLGGALAYRGVRLLAELHKNKKIKHLKKIRTIMIKGKV